MLSQSVSRTRSFTEVHEGGGNMSALKQKNDVRKEGVIEGTESSDSGFSPKQITHISWDGESTLGLKQHF